jgi:hypothetical protein
MRKTDLPASNASFHDQGPPTKVAVVPHVSYAQADADSGARYSKNVNARKRANCGPRLKPRQRNTVLPRCWAR